MKLTPLNGLVTLKRCPIKQDTGDSLGFFVPELPESVERGIVVARDESEPCRVTPGQCVLFPKQSGVDIGHGESAVVLLKEKDLIAIDEDFNTKKED